MDGRETIDDDCDPSLERRVAKLTAGIAKGNTFRAIAEELIIKMKRENCAKVTIDKTKWVFGFAYPFIGDRPISEITAPEVLARSSCSKRKGNMKRRGAFAASAGKFSGLQSQRAAPSVIQPPTFAALSSPPPQVTHRAAITTAKEVGPVHNAVDGFTSRLTTKLALNLPALAFVRP